MQPAAPCLPADAVLAGLPLALRALLTLQQQGAKRLLLVAAEPLASALTSDARLQVPVEILAPTAAGAVDWQALRARVDERFVLVRHDWLLAPAGYRALLDVELADEATALLGWIEGGFAHALAGQPGLLAAFAADGLSWETLAAAAAPLVPQPVQLELGRLELGRLELAASWGANAATKSGRALAMRQLFEACRKPVDGVVSRHLNRHISLWISRRLVNTAITPNAMTAVTFGVGLGAAWFATRGGYENTLIAALLMQFNSILDGCDGELARVRFQGSKLGQWLDTIGDDVSNVLFWTALGFGALAVPDVPWLPDAGVWLARCAWVTALGNALSAAQYYILLWRLGSGDFYAIQQDDRPPAGGLGGALVRLFSVILKQDFFLLLVLLLAALDLLMWSLPIMAVGALITLSSATLRSLRARSARK